MSQSARTAALHKSHWRETWRCPSLHLRFSISTFDTYGWTWRSSCQQQSLVGSRCGHLLVNRWKFNVCSIRILANSKVLLGQGVCVPKTNRMQTKRVGGGPQSSSTVQPCTLAPERGMEAPFRHLRFSVPHLMVQISTSFKVSLSPAAAPERVLIVPPTR